MAVEKPTDRSVGSIAIVVAILLLVLASLFFFYGLLVFWPPASTGSGSAAAGEQPVQFLIWTWTPSRESRLFLIVGFAGALGGLVHSLRSLSWYVGNKELKWSWVPMYALLPFVGATLATIFYVALRAGLITTQASPQDVSPYGIAAIAGLVGLFSQQAAEKLKQVSETVLTSAPKGKDTVPSEPPVISGFTPPTAAPGSVITITGTGLSGATAVWFGTMPAVPSTTSDGTITVKVPDGATTGPISVTTPAGTGRSGVDFTVSR